VGGVAQAGGHDFEAPQRSVVERLVASSADVYREPDGVCRLLLPAAKERDQANAQGDSLHCRGTVSGRPENAAFLPPGRGTSRRPASITKMNAAPAQGRCREPEPASCYFGFCESVGLLGLFGGFVLLVLLVFVEPELSTPDPGLEVPVPVLLVPLEEVPAPTPVVGEVLVDEPVVAVLSVEVPVVAVLSVEVPVVAFPLELTPVFGFVLGLAPTVALPVALVSEPVVDPLTVPLVPARVSSPVVPGVAVPVVPVALPVPVPVPEGFTGVPALVVPGEPALVPPPVCAKAPAAARAAAARIVPVSLPILITSSFAATMATARASVNPRKRLEAKKRRSVPCSTARCPSPLPHSPPPGFAASDRLRRRSCSGDAIEQCG